MNYREKEALAAIAARLRERLPGKIAGLRAFGSRVRGDHGPWSDFDVLVLVDGRTPLLETAIIDIFVQEEQRFGYSFTPVVKDVRAFARERELSTAFYENVEREGVAL